MRVVILFLGGCLAGALVMLVVMHRGLRRGFARHELADDYRVARRAVLDHLGAHGTINLASFERLIDADGLTLLTYLEHLESDGVIRKHGHTDSGVFYTRA